MRWLEGVGGRRRCGRLRLIAWHGTGFKRWRRQRRRLGYGSGLGRHHVVSVVRQQEMAPRRSYDSRRRWTAVAMCGGDDCD
ncbi:hypothetical protein E2562_034433 [Oryza meyeriana var. granulata]|uniref:Uncharacterized protein n=1 Tax=Oryza meyeriana var. granulata TaxID=110450 RepID=A0A6G1FF57_9ORYZ|nr:hypothetical protein E2562_034433 [Oryza meyeriana var. granulata]